MEIIPQLSNKEIALNKVGATRELAYKTYVEACSAMITKYDRDGDEIGSVPDHPTRVKAADSISRLNGDLKDTMTVENKSITINISVEALGALVDMVKDVRDQLSRNDGKQTGEIITIEGMGSSGP